MSLPRSKSTGVISSSSHRPTPTRGTSTVSPTVTSPRQEHEDPFSLAAFFPTQRSASVDQFNVQFQWAHRIARSEEDEDEEDDENHDGGEAESPVDELWPRTPGGDLLGEKEDGYAHGVLLSEDKFGILAFDSEQLSRKFTGVFSSPLDPRHDGHGDDRPLSPYAHEDPIDDESLWNALRARRRAQTQPVSSFSRASARHMKKNMKPKAQGPGFGELFLPAPASTKAQGQSAQPAGWSVPLYKQMQDFVESL